MWVYNISLNLGYEKLSIRSNIIFEDQGLFFSNKNFSYFV